MLAAISWAFAIRVWLSRTCSSSARTSAASASVSSSEKKSHLEAPYAEYERGLAGLLEKRRAAEAALTAIVSEYVDRTLPEATNDPGQANLPPPPTIPQATAPPRLASDLALYRDRPSGQTGRLARHPRGYRQRRRRRGWRAKRPVWPEGRSRYP